MLEYFIENYIIPAIAWFCIGFFLLQPLFAFGDLKNRLRQIEEEKLYG